MIISLPKHFHLYRDFVKVCSRLAFGAYMYRVLIKFEDIAVLLIT